MQNASTSKREQPKRGEYLVTVILVSIVILIYQGISNSDLGVISQLTHQKGNDWAGPLSTALLFMGSGLGSLYNKYIGRYPYKITFFVGSFGYTLFISMGLIFVKIGFTTLVQVLIFLGSFISGVIVSMFYNTQYNYINELSKRDNQSVKYFGINLGMVQSSNLFGSFLSWLLIKPLGQFLYLLVMDIIVFATSFGYFFTVREPAPIAQLQNDPENDNEHSIIQEERNKEEQKDKNIAETVGHEQINAHYCGICYAFTGIIVGFVYTGLSVILYRTFQDNMSEIQLNKLTFNVFIFEGVGECVGGVSMIFFEHRIKDVAKGYMLLSTLFMAFVGVIYLGCMNESVVVICIGVVVVGFCDCVSMVLALSLAGRWREKGITAYNIWQCTAVASTVMFLVFVPFQALFAWNAAFYLVCLFVLYRYRLRAQAIALKQSQALLPQANPHPIQKSQ